MKLKVPNHETKRDYGSFYDYACKEQKTMSKKSYIICYT